MLTFEDSRGSVHRNSWHFLCNLSGNLKLCQKTKLKKKKRKKLNLCLTLSQLLETIGLPNKNSAWNFSTFLTDVGCTFDRAGNCHSKHAY